jgi:hypothetical protein
VPLSAALLQVFNLSDIRRGLKIIVYGGPVLLVVAAGWRQRKLLAVAASITGTGMFFWGLPYFGQSLCHAAGDAFVVLGIACLLFWSERLSRPETFIPFCAAYGAGVVYMEMLTGLLPTAAGLLFPIAYLIMAMRLHDENWPLQAWFFATTGEIAFALGAIITVVIKQILALLIIGSSALSSFVTNLVLYTTMPVSRYENAVGSFLMPFVALLRNGVVLAYGSKLGAIVLYVATALAWLAAGWLAVRKNGARPVSDFLAFGVGAAVIAGWVMLLPTHTIMHFFMARILVVPIALGWGALAWQLQAASGLDRAGLEVGR